MIFDLPYWIIDSTTLIIRNETVTALDVLLVRLLHIHNSIFNHLYSKALSTYCSANGRLATEGDILFRHVS